MSNNITNPDQPNLPYYVATYQSRSVAIKRDADYQNTIRLVQKSIAKLRGVYPQDILISAALVDYGGALVQISEEIWPNIVGDVRTVEIGLDDPTDAGHSASGRADDGEENAAPIQTAERVATVVATAEPITEHTHSRAASPQTVQDSTNILIDPGDTFSITVRTSSQELLELGNLHSSSIIRDIKSLIEATYVPAILQSLDLLGHPLDDSKTLEQCKITDWTIFDLYLNARQYMIYLYPDPTLRTPERFPHKNIEVTLSLNRAWELATLRPSRETRPKDYVQSMSWTVDVAWGGLLEHSSTAERICLFWDGISRPAQSVTPNLSPPQSQLESHPPYGRPNLVPLLDPTNSAEVPFSGVEVYVQKVFYQMGFTDYSSSPTHFTSHLKQKPHEYIALRFASQADCEAISSLSISPPTEHITRVLVLYKGLNAVAARTWDLPQPRHAQESDPWKSVVNRKYHAYWNNDAGLKVLEVGWMEVC